MHPEIVSFTPSHISIINDDGSFAQQALLICYSQLQVHYSSGFSNSQSYKNNYAYLLI